MSQRILLIAFLMLLGLIVGSFLGTLVLRLPENKPVVLSRSSCPKCGRRLTPVELVPLLSWSVQEGRCRGCGQSIGNFYPLMEGAAAVVPLWAGFSTTGPGLFFSTVLGWLLLSLAVMDARTYRLSDALTLPLVVVGIISGAVLDWDHVLDRTIGAIAGFVVLFALARLYAAYRGQEGLGTGDAKLFGAGGAWVGWQGLAPVALIAGVSGLAAIVIGRALGFAIDAKTRIPFGVFLALGIWIDWLYVPGP
jgi:leader peptidase (prepilin peptidase) / N-methyltransferase